MGLKFESKKKYIFSDRRPIPEKQGPVRGNKNIFKVGPTCMLGPSIHRLATDKQVELYWKYFVEAELFKTDI